MIQDIASSNPFSDNNFRAYFLDGEELWARAYAQYIAQNSNHAPGLSELEAMRKDSSPSVRLRIWPDDQFATIAPLITNVFRTLSWIP